MNRIASFLVVVFLAVATVAGWPLPASAQHKAHPVHSAHDPEHELGEPTRDTYGFEIFYNVEINPWLRFTPDLQIVRTDRKGQDTAIIPGARPVIDF